MGFTMKFAEVEPTRAEIDAIAGPLASDPRGLFSAKGLTAPSHALISLPAQAAHSFRRTRHGARKPLPCNRDGHGLQSVSRACERFRSWSNRPC
jgi:hypothetical protein